MWGAGQMIYDFRLRLDLDKEKERNSKSPGPGSKWVAQWVQKKK